MGALERYILRSAATSFVASLFATTAVVWISQALRDFDLMTAKGQSLWTYFSVTLLAVPSFALIVTPLALFGAVLFTLNRLNTDSELAAISASGARPFALLRPFLVLALIVSVAAGALSLSAIPSSLRTLREMLTEIRADIVVNILREGEFTSIGPDVTIHVRRREAGAALTGVLIDDNRDKSENVVYTAERGQVIKNAEGSFLVLQKGAMQRKERSETDASLVVFDSYAFDLSPFSQRELDISYRPRELYVSELWKPPAQSKGPSPQRLRAEFHERVLNGLYPFAFMCIAFAALARPKTTRQGRFTNILAAVVVMFAVRIAGMGLINIAKSSELAVVFVYAVPLGTAFGALAIALGLHRSFRRLPRRTARPAGA